MPNFFLPLFAAEAIVISTHLISLCILLPNFFNKEGGAVLDALLYPWSDKSDIPKQWHHVHGTAFSISIQRGVVSLAAVRICNVKIRCIHSFISGHTRTASSTIYHQHQHQHQHRHRLLKRAPSNNGAPDRPHIEFFSWRF